MLGDAQESQSLLLSASAGIYFKTLGLKPIDKSFGFWRCLKKDWRMSHTVTCARGHRQLTDHCDDAASEFWWSVSVGINCPCVFAIPRDIRTQDFRFPVCCDGTCTRITKVPADLYTSIPVTGPMLT